MRAVLQVVVVGGSWGSRVQYKYIIELCYPIYMI